MSQVTIISEMKKHPIKVNDSLSLSQIFYTHLEEFSTFVVTYRYQNSTHVIGTRTELDVDQISNNKTLIDNITKTILRSLSDEERSLRINALIKIINSRIEKEILAHEE